MANSNLNSAKNNKNDEFYTELSVIQSEINHYIDKLRNKIILCNCDDPFESNFVKYFLMNFNRLGLKELIATGYKTSTIGGNEIGQKNTPYALRVSSTTKYLKGTQKDLDLIGAKSLLTLEGNKITFPLMGNNAIDENGNQIYEEIKEEYLDNNGKTKTKKVQRAIFYEAGDFRSNESISLLEQADVIITNPPFSLFRDFISTLLKHNKQFLILGSIQAITYKEFFPLLKDNKVWLGYNNGSKEYMVIDSFAEKYPDKVYKKDNKWYSKLGNTVWYTNLDHMKRHTSETLNLGFQYIGHEEMYPTFDNYDAINVSKVNEIPCDFIGIMGVPISFLDKHNPDQFELIGVFNHGSDHEFDLAKPTINGVEKFKKLAIKYSVNYITKHPELFLKKGD